MKKLLGLLLIAGLLTFGSCGQKGGSDTTTEEPATTEEPTATEEPAATEMPAEGDTAATEGAMEGDHSGEDHSGGGH